MHLKYSALVVFAAFCLMPIFAATLNSKRSIKTIRSTNENEHTTPRNGICQSRTPCGWAIYDKLTRYIDYFMRNTCDCPEGKECLRGEDDISITAYVYRCKLINS